MKIRKDPSPAEAVRILNACCPTCGGPIYHSPEHCRTCLQGEAARLARAREAGKRLEAMGA